jgi:hypothetical protein
MIPLFINMILHHLGGVFSSEDLQSCTSFLLAPLYKSVIIFWDPYNIENPFLHLAETLEVNIASYTVSTTSSLSHASNSTSTFTTKMLTTDSIHARLLIVTLLLFVCLFVEMEAREIAPIDVDYQGK